MLLHREVVAAVPRSLQAVLLGGMLATADDLAAGGLLSHGVRRGCILAADLMRHVVVVLDVVGERRLGSFFLASAVGGTGCVRGVRLVQMAGGDVLLQVVLLFDLEGVGGLGGCTRALPFVLEATGGS